MRLAHLRLEESKRLVYERRYHKQYEKARSEFVSDSANLDIIKKNFSQLYSFTLQKKNWSNYLSKDYDLNKNKGLKKDKELILQICRNRWAEGIYNITINDINSDQVAVNQGTLADLTSPDSFNDLELAWIKSKKERKE